MNMQDYYSQLKSAQNELKHWARHIDMLIEKIRSLPHFEESADELQEMYLNDLKLITEQFSNDIDALNNPLVD